MSERFTVLVLGASARAAAHSAALAGWNPIAADLFADRDLAELCPTIRIGEYPRGFLRAVEERAAQAWIYTGGLENHSRLLARLAARLPLWGNAGGSLRRVRNPWRFAAALRAAGLNAPQLLPPRAKVVPASRWLRKPLRSAGGLGIVEGGEPHGRSYVQEYIEGRSCSAVFLAMAGGTLLCGITRQLHGPAWHAGPFGYAGSLGPLTNEEAGIGPERADPLKAIGDLLAGEFGLRGLVGVDFLVNERGVWPVEVNPRYTASVEILERSRGGGLLGLHRSACVGGEVVEPPFVHEPRSERLEGKAIVYARSALIVPETLPAWLTARDALGRPAAADLPQAGVRIEPGQPVLTVFAAGEDCAALEASLAALVDRAWDELAKMQAAT